MSWQYQNWAGAQAYSPGLIDVARRQHTQLTRATLWYELTKQQALYLEYRGVRNRENISLFEYQSRAWQLGWQWQFGRLNAAHKPHVASHRSRRCYAVQLAA